MSRTFSVLSLLACLTAAMAAGTEASGPARPGPVVVDVRGRVAGGYGMGPWVSYGVEPEVLVLWPGGHGIGLDLGYGIVNGAGGAMSVASVGVKYAAVRLRSPGPLAAKSGAGASLLLDSNGRIGARVRLEAGFALLATRRMAFPVEAIVTGEVYGSGGAALMVGLSLGAGWVFAGR